MLADESDDRSRRSQKVDPTWAFSEQGVSKNFRFADRSATLAFASRVGHLMLERCLPELRIGECSCEVIWTHQDGSCENCQDHACSRMVQEVYDDLLAVAEPVAD